MKNFIKILAVIFAMYFIGSCEYDDKFIVEEHDGFSTVVKIDTVYSSEGNLGIQISNYLDLDYSNGYSFGDFFQNSYTIWNGLNGTNGLDARINITRLSPNQDCPVGSLLFQSYQGNNLVSSLTFCLPENGTNGTDGFSPVMKVDEYTDGTLLGNLISFFLDKDRDNQVSPGDSYIGGFIVFNGKDGADGESPEVVFKIVESDCESGQEMIVTSYLGGNIISTASFCIPSDGQDGQDGTNGFNPVMSIHECIKDGVIFGHLIEFFLDADRNGLVSIDDPYMGGFFVRDGQDGQDGQDGVDGKTVMVTFDLVESSTCSSGKSMVFTSSLDGQIISQKSFCIPSDGQDGADGENGLTPSLETFDYFGCGCDCIVYRWYFDLNNDGVYDSGDILISEEIICDGQDGDPATALVTLTLEYDFQAAGTSYFNSTGFLLNGFVLNDGALYLDQPNGYVSLPPFSNNIDLLSLRFNYGSTNSYDITVKAIYADNSEAVVKTVHLTGNPAFQRGIYSTYSSFEYYSNLGSIAFKDVKRIKIVGTHTLKCVPEDLFIDQIIINLLDRNH